MSTPKPRDHMARVCCPDEVWAEFKRLAQTDGWQPVNEYLGALVGKEVASQNRLRARAEDATARQVLAALDQAKELRSELAGITVRLEALVGHRTEPAVPVVRASDWDVSPTPEQRAEWTRREAERVAAGDVWRPPVPEVDVPEWEP